MTNEQAKEILKCNTDLGHGVIIENESTQSIYEALDMAIKALEQQPSDDCVSRADAKKYLSAPDANGDRVIYASDLDLLPPVTPTFPKGATKEERKVGKWVMPDKYYDKNIWRKCSVCNTHFEKYHKYVTFSGEVTYTEEIANYCKVCGAEMRGSEK